MSKIRIKAAIPVITTQHEAEQVLNELAVITNNKRKLTADMDAETLAVTNKYQPHLTACDDAAQVKLKSLETWADANPGIFPKDRKSVMLLAGKIGFRLDTPSLVLQSRTVTWTKVLGIIIVKKWRKFKRIKVEVDKDAILARCGTLEKPTKFQKDILPTLGLKLVQEEKFFAEPNLTETEVVK
jgi:phage host-nuclease inhibitor protein Gam